MHDGQRHDPEAGGHFDGNDAVADVAFVGFGDELGLGEWFGDSLVGLELSLHLSGDGGVEVGLGPQLGETEFEGGALDFFVEGGECRVFLSFVPGVPGSVGLGGVAHREFFYILASLGSRC